jgi:hypothetical protein
MDILLLIWIIVWQHGSGQMCLRNLEFIKQRGKPKLEILLKINSYLLFPFDFWKFYEEYCHRAKRNWKRNKKPIIIPSLKHMNTFHFALFFISHYPYLCLLYRECEVDFIF